MTTHSNYLDTERRAYDTATAACPFCGYRPTGMGADLHVIIRDTAECADCNGLWIWDRTAMDAYVTLVDLAETYHDVAADLADWHEAAACAVLACIDTDVDADA
jgi:hypothetical protein